jgi:hypothetical protein
MTDNSTQHFGSSVELLRTVSSNWENICLFTHMLMIYVCSEVGLIGGNLIRPFSGDGA